MEKTIRFEHLLNKTLDEARAIEVVARVPLKRGNGFFCWVQFEPEQWDTVEKGNVFVRWFAKECEVMGMKGDVRPPYIYEDEKGVEHLTLSLTSYTEVAASK